MGTDNLIAKLYASSKTVFTVKDIALLWKESDRVKLYNKIKYYANQGSLLRLTRGVFAKNKEYNVKELATKIYSPSYVSFETVLREAGVVFQHHEATFVAGPYPCRKTIEGHRFVFRRLKKSVLYSSAGIKIEKNYSIATPERAFLDVLYLNPKFHFDNLNRIDWDLCFKLVKIYNNQELVKRLNSYQKYAK